LPIFLSGAKRGYVGVDSDPPVWIETRSPAIGFISPILEKAKKWGTPTKRLLGKQIWTFELASLVMEMEPFDGVYLVDG
jgi:hypothetical protein